MPSQPRSWKNSVQRREVESFDLPETSRLDQDLRWFVYRFCGSVFFLQKEAGEYELFSFGNTTVFPGHRYGAFRALPVLCQVLPGVGSGVQAVFLRCCGFLFICCGLHKTAVFLQARTKGCKLENMSCRPLPAVRFLSFLFFRSSGSSYFWSIFWSRYF